MDHYFKKKTAILIAIIIVLGIILALSSCG